MKRCSNCNDFALYDDEIVFCPICDSRLVTYTSERIQVDDTIVQTHRADAGNQGPNTPVFETTNGRTHIFHGIVTEISPQSRWNNRFKKLINAIFIGEPYQFGNTSQSCVLRLEEFHSGRMASQRRSVVFYGEAEGRIAIGDDVMVTAKRQHNRFIATRLQVNDTGEMIRPIAQIPSGIIKFFAGFFAILLLYLVIGFVGLVATGSFASFLSGLLGGLFNIALKVFGAFAPILIIYLAIKLMFRR